MNLSPDDGAFDNEDSDSFHSFNDSELSHRLNLSASWRSSLSSDSDSATGFESEHETSVSLEDEYSVETQLQAPKETPTKALFGMPHPKSSESECSSNSSACDGVSNNNDARQQMGRFKTLKKFMVSPLSRTEEPLPICPRKVPELTSKQVPDEELFDLDSPQLRLQNYLTSDQKTQANLKNAFTEIWVDWQQNSSTRSPLREFSGALDAYFNQDLTNMTSKKPNDTIVQPIMKPAETIMAPVTKPAEEYVSPFKNMPIQAAPPKETPLLDGAKKPIIVPAGFDLTRLVQFKNPNHWARRKHVRTGDRVL